MVSRASMVRAGAGGWCDGCQVYCDERCDDDGCAWVQDVRVCRCCVSGGSGCMMTMMMRCVCVDVLCGVCVGYVSGVCVCVCVGAMVYVRMVCAMMIEGLRVGVRCGWCDGCAT